MRIAHRTNDNWSCMIRVGIGMLQICGSSEARTLFKGNSACHKVLKSWNRAGKTPSLPAAKA